MHQYVVLASVKTVMKSQRRREVLGRTLRERREAMGLSQEKFGEMVDCHRNYVGLIERGQQNVTIDMLGRFAAALSCSIADLASEAGV
jgi:transcriptional regulator with XRE-family HTH domain